MVPTPPQSLTAEGTILGTFQYMAPEQLEGTDADARTDIFAFGALMYEMVTGHKAFDGKSQAQPDRLDHQREPGAHLVSSADDAARARAARADLSDEGSRREADRSMMSRRSCGGLPKADRSWVRRRRSSRTANRASGSHGRSPLSVASRRSPPPHASCCTPMWRRSRFDSPLSHRPASSCHFRACRRMDEQSPFVGTAAARNRVIDLDSQRRFVRRAGARRDRRRAASLLVADSNYLAYFAGTQLKKVSIAGGPPQLIAMHPGGADGSWGSQNVIVFDGRPTDPIWRVSAGGGSVTVAMKPDPTRKEVGVAWPYFLPDGKHFVFSGNSPEGPISLRVGALDEEGSTFLSDLQSRVEYSSGYLVYVSQNTMVARPFSTKMRTFTGDPFPVTDRIEIGSLGLVDFSLSQTGDLAYITQAAELKSRPLWTNRAGQELGTVGDPSVFGDIALAPDGSRVAASVTSKAGPKSSTTSGSTTFDAARRLD